MAKVIREEVFRHHPRMQRWKKVLLVLPAVLSVSWIFYLRYSEWSTPYYSQEMLAPSSTAPLIIALSIFTIGYVIFLLLMFSDNIKEFFTKKNKA